MSEGRLLDYYYDALALLIDDRCIARYVLRTI